MQIDQSPRIDSSSALPPATGSSNINLSTTERLASGFGGLSLILTGAPRAKSVGGVALIAGGAYLIVRGFSGYCALRNRLQKSASMRTAKGMEASAHFIVNRPRADVYSFWRSLENLPEFMKHLQRVDEISDRHSSWTAKLPGGIGTVSWEAEITKDIPGQSIMWSSLPGSKIDNAGQVVFEDSPTGGTEVTVRISYRLPAGDLGAFAAKLFNPSVEKMMRSDLRDLKRILESSNELGGDVTERRTASLAGKQSYTVSGFD